MFFLNSMFFIGAQIIKSFDLENLSRIDKITICLAGFSVVMFSTMFTIIENNFIQVIIKEVVTDSTSKQYKSMFNSLQEGILVVKQTPLRKATSTKRGEQKRIMYSYNVEFANEMGNKILNKIFGVKRIFKKEEGNDMAAKRRAGKLRELLKKRIFHEFKSSSGDAPGLSSQ